jgi:hypothetical protein
MSNKMVKNLDELRAKVNYLQEWDDLPISRRSSYKEAADDLAEEVLDLVNSIDNQNCASHPVANIFKLLSEHLIRACAPDASPDKVETIPEVGRLLWEITREWRS